jgi:hypothetical protein
MSADEEDATNFEVTIPLNFNIQSLVFVVTYFKNLAQKWTESAVAPVQ